MNYLSAKQLSEKWGISPRRVTRLAADGRIEGAVNMGRAWIFPENAEKPVDARSKETPAPPADDKYCFPYILYTVHSKEQADGLTPDEKALYHADCLYEAGEFEECLGELNELLETTENKYIRLGVLYLLPFVYMNLSDFENTEKYSVLFTAAFYENTDRCDELDFLFNAFNMEIASIEKFGNSLKIDHELKCSDELLPAVYLYNIFSELSKYYEDLRVENVFSHELLCEKIEREGNFYVAILIRSYISIMYGFLHDEENECRNLRRAVDTAIEHNCFVSLMVILSYYQDSVVRLMKEYPKDVRKRFGALMTQVTKARTEFSLHCGASKLLSQLKEEDYILISCCVKNYSIDKIADILSLSESGTKKRLSALYKKFGADNKKEMMQKYYDIFGNLDRRKSAKQGMKKV